MSCHLSHLIRLGSQQMARDGWQYVYCYATCMMGSSKDCGDGIHFAQHVHALTGEVGVHSMPASPVLLGVEHRCFINTLSPPLDGISSYIRSNEVPAAVAQCAAAVITRLLQQTASGASLEETSLRM